MRLLVVSRMFPSEMHPSAAIFFANFLQKLNPLLEDLLVVSPRVYIPWVLAWRKRWARHRNVTTNAVWEGIEVVRPPFLYIPSDHFLPFAGAAMARSISSTVTRIIANRRFDAILGFNAIPDGDAAVRLSRQLRIPAIVWCIGTDINDYPNKSTAVWRSAEKLLQGASLVVTSSCSLADRVKAICPTASNVRPFYRGLDLEIFRALSRNSRRSLNIPDEALVLIHVGRLMRQKGIRELLAAFSKFASQTRPVYLIMVGENVMGGEIDALLAKCPHPERIIRPGIVSYNEIAHYLSAADILVLGSYQEGLPNAVLEAMAAGVAVIAANVGGIPEIVTDQETGLLIPAKDSEALYQAISRLIEDDNLRKHCVTKARNLVFEKFDAEVNAKVFLKMLDEVVWGMKSPATHGETSIPSTMSVPR